MNAHTPGPWAIKGRINSSGECVRIESRHAAQEHLGYQVADVMDANGFAQNAANARLIVAAPDLYEALVRLMQHLPPNDDDEYGLYDAAKDRARAAIEKAVQS